MVYFIGFIRFFGYKPGQAPAARAVEQQGGMTSIWVPTSSSQIQIQLQSQIFLWQLQQDSSDVRKIIKLFKETTFYLWGEVLLSRIDLFKVSILQVSSSVSSVILSVFSDPFFCNLMESVSVISSSLYICDRFWQDFGQNRHKWEDSCSRHKLKNNDLKFLLLSCFSITCVILSIHSYTAWNSCCWAWSFLNARFIISCLWKQQNTFHM